MNPVKEAKTIIEQLRSREWKEWTPEYLLRAGGRLLLLLDQIRGLLVEAEYKCSIEKATYGNATDRHVLEYVKEGVSKTEAQTRAEVDMWDKKLSYLASEREFKMLKGLCRIISELVSYIQTDVGWNKTVYINTEVKK